MKWTSIALLAAVVCAFGCQKGSFSERTSTTTGSTGAGTSVLRYPIQTNPTSLDPGMTQDGDTLDVIQQVYEGLVGWGPDNQVHGILAENWDVSPDGKKYTFHLKKGVKFHSGREVTADDFKWSIERNTDIALASPVTGYLTDIVGVDAKIAKNSKVKDISGYKVIDPSTIEITLKEPTPYFLGKLTYLISAVMDKDVTPVGKPMTDLKQMIGTGPFKMSKYERNQIVVVTRNDDYHGGKPKLDAIERPIILDASTRLAKYKTGELDMTFLQRQDVEGINADPVLKDQMKQFDRPSIYYIAMNQLVYAPFKDKKVRQAFAMALNKDNMVNTLMNGQNRVANSIVPPGCLGYRENAKVYPYDPEAAKKLLAEAGYANAKGMPTLELYFRESVPDVKLIAEAAQRDLKANLNVDVKLMPLEWAAYLQKFNAKQLPFYHMRWAADYLDPQNFLSYMLATWGPENKLGYNNPEFDQNCKMGDTTMEWEKRAPYYAKAEDIVLQDAVWVPIYFQKDNELHSPRLSGMRESLFGHLPHTTTALEAK
jgi:ABC-type transport system substrate-binding protein